MYASAHGRLCSIQYLSGPPASRVSAYVYSMHAQTPKNDSVIYCRQTRKRDACQLSMQMPHHAHILVTWSINHILGTTTIYPRVSPSPSGESSCHIAGDGNYEYANDFSPCPYLSLLYTGKLLPRPNGLARACMHAHTHTHTHTHVTFGTHFFVHAYTDHRSYYGGGHVGYESRSWGMHTGHIRTLIHAPLMWHMSTPSAQKYVCTQVLEHGTPTTNQRTCSCPRSTWRVSPPTRSCSCSGSTATLRASRCSGAL